MAQHPDNRDLKPHSAHWGAFSAGMRDGKLVVLPHPADPDPNLLLQNFPDSLRHRARIARPMVRRGWLEHGPRPDDRRGRDKFVAVSWDRALDLLANELAGCAMRMGRVRSSVAPTAGPAPGGSTMRRDRCTGS